ncbi:MAG: hypothetical protein ABII12_16990 [Planctomycetota bacterium]
MGRHCTPTSGFTAILSAATLIGVFQAQAAFADIAENQVLVVYNSAAGSDATVLTDAYLAAHPGIPAENVLDLNDAALDVSDVSRSTFVSNVRDPIRSHLLLAGPPTPEGIVAIALIRPFPHRILDTDLPAAGDNPSQASSEANAGDATFASLDADLVLLWQDLETGESGGQMDSLADNMIDNPYHGSAADIGSFSRSAIQTAKTFSIFSNFAYQIAGVGATRLTPGDIYLVCRIDGNTLDDAVATIGRGDNLWINKAFGKILLDEFDVTVGNELDDEGFGPFPTTDDYETTRTVLQASGWNVRYDDTADFITSAEETDPLIAYASYGENHSQGGAGENPPGSGTYIQGFKFPVGAIFNTIESYNARGLNGLGTLFNQEQAADFIAEGGTFAVGHVWEPFAFSVPDNEFLLANMLGGQMTWAEAAYTCLPALSWQQVILGDPLAKPTIVTDPGLPQGDLDGDGSVNGLDIAWFVDLVLSGSAAYHSTFPMLDPVARGDFDGDCAVTTDDVAPFVSALLGP